MDAAADKLQSPGQLTSGADPAVAAEVRPCGNGIINLILGRSLATREHEQVKIGVFAAVPAMGLDALGSASYGPEAALTILLPLGAMGLAYLWPITLVIVTLLTILFFSYRQTIATYPVNGGSYTVATENLGVWPGLLAAAALMIDYLLNVAVGISAGVAALISAAPTRRARTTARVRLCINGIGAVSTGIALLIVLSAKFIESAWICVVAIPVLLAMFKLIHRHYDCMKQQLTAVAPLDLDHNQPPVVLVTTKQWDRPTEKALRFSFWISHEVIALLLSNLSGDEADEEETRIRNAWRANVESPAQRHGVRPPRLDIRPAPFRSIINPLMKELDRLAQEFPTRQIAVLTPQLVEKHWWNVLLHRRKSGRLRAALLRRCDERIVLISMPWYVNE